MGSVDTRFASVSTPLAGAKVTVSDPSFGQVKSSGTTAANGSVILTYSVCRDAETKKLLPCDGLVKATGFADGEFDAP